MKLLRYRTIRTMRCNLNFVMALQSNYLLAYEQNHSKRIDSRRWYKEGFAKKMTTFKTKTGDKSSLVFKNKDKNGELTIYTTNPQELSYSNMQGEEAEGHTLNNSI